VLEELRNGMVKINPLVRWTAKDTYEYMQRTACR
jgi:3'-phosphoadenosine 5'-phosphosulfate sulfotransferase (PAPS reductase)/FAD synthetase